jgi:predicted ferric reductase
MTLIAAAASPLWYLSRGAGLTSLVLLSAAVVLGVLVASGYGTKETPRFYLSGLHRSVSLMSVVMVGIHIVAIELDTYVAVGWLGAVVPFASPYRTIWTGLGAVALDLMLAVAVTSIMRSRVGYSSWRLVHWLAYLSWPVAIVHGLGDGSDSRAGWAELIYLACALAVLAAVVYRLIMAKRLTVASRWGVGLAGLGAAVAIALWAISGPLQAGWSARAGTPVPSAAAAFESQSHPVGAIQVDRRL